MACAHQMIYGKNIIEGWLMYPLKVRVDSVNPKTKRSVSGNNQQQLAPPVFTVPGKADSALSPRFTSTGFGSTVSYNLPDEKNLAVEPNNPLQLSPLQMAKAVENRDIVEKELKENLF
jgi:hypothetical protein